MSRPGYVDRQMLKSWADQLASKGEFPRLVRQLILETTPDVLALGMPAGEGVAAGGWDGSVRSTMGNAWVPKGYSVWELSVDSSPGVKADRDYVKRDSTPDGTKLTDTTYVEVILRPWIDRNTWAKDKTAAGTWKRVCALGLDDIETWLQSAPVTWAWLSEEFGLNPFGLRTGRSWWATWNSQTVPAIPSDLPLAGRDEQMAELLQPVVPGIVTITGPSVKDVCAFICAAAVKRERDGDGQFLARLALVDDLASWRRLLESPSPLILVALDPGFATEVPPECKHTILVPTVAHGDADISLAKLDASKISKALRDSGFQPQEQTDELGRLARRSLTALRRRLAKKSSLVHPPWADSPTTRAIRAILMLGSWADNKDGDRLAAEALSGMSYEDFRSECARLSAGEDPLITIVAGTWHLVSPVDAWMLLTGSLTSDDLNRLETVLVLVIGETDPALQLPEETRWWKASFEGKQRVHSADLRRGLSETLALLGTHGTANADNSSAPTDWVRFVVRQLLDAANADNSGHGWQSIAPMLPRLAEAAPDVFADAVTRAVTQENSILATMFAAPNDDALFASSSHVHLLWALEVLAWSEQHFGQAIDLLARLDRLDPGGRSSNRPAESLSAIFCPWHPETTASSERRLKVLDALRRRYPDTAWPLLTSLLPTAHPTHFPTHAPDYRDWKPTHIPVSQTEYEDFVLAILNRLIHDAGNTVSRWIGLVDHYNDLPPKGREAFLAGLAILQTSNEFDDSGRIAIWKKLHKLVGEHREFATAFWALSEDELSRVEVAASGFAPTTASARSMPLFDDWSPYLGDVSRVDDHEQYETSLREHRIRAMSEIVAEEGIEVAISFTRKIKFPWAAGYALGAGSKTFDDKMFELLAADTANDAEAAFAYFQRRFQDEGWALIRELLARYAEAPATQRAEMLLATRDVPTSWEVAAENEDVNANYWQRFSCIGLGPDFGYIEIVARALMKAGRYAHTLQFLKIYSNETTIDGVLRANLIATALEQLLHNQEQIAPAGLHDYDFASMLSILERHTEELGSDRVANLEWSYLGALGHNPAVPTLSRTLAISPDFFVELISSVYRADDSAEQQQGPEDNNRASIARNAYNLLKTWNEPPGLVEGVMQADSLCHWVDQVSKKLGPSRRLAHAAEHLGEVLTHTPADPDDVWPGEVVREFLEEKQDEHIETGIYRAIVNGRGVTSRGPEEGGAQEDTLAAKYEADAIRVADEAPRSAAILRKIAESYRQDARRNEALAERFRTGLA